MQARHWRTLNRPDLNLVDELSRGIGELEVRDHLSMPDLRRGSRIIVASDYGGEHDGAHFRVYSFLLAGAWDFKTWEAERDRWRKKHLPDGRRLRYARLDSDVLRRRATLPFLELFNRLDGILATVAVDVRIQSLFEEHGFIDPQAPGMQSYRHLAPHILEKLLRIVHFGGLLIAGLARPLHDVWWIGDDDPIVHDRKGARGLPLLCESAEIVLREYLPFELSRLLCATTQSDDGTQWTEDLAALPDLVAGALGDVLGEQSRTSTLPNGQLTLPVPESVPDKAKDILGWLSSDQRPLRQLVIAITPAPAPMRYQTAIMQYSSLHDALRRR